MVLYIVGLVIGGLVVGFLARLLHPGKDAMSIWMTLGLGIVSMLIAGLVVRPLIGFGGGLITAIIIAIVLLVVYGRVAAGNRGRHRPAMR
jgi:uncharacterized membrane protein YeaQ/YmgE (transglycosylase-associated protein family)